MGQLTHLKWSEKYNQVNAIYLFQNRIMLHRNKKVWYFRVSLTPMLLKYKTNDIHLQVTIIDSSTPSWVVRYSLLLLKLMKTFFFIIGTGKIHFGTFRKNWQCLFKNNIRRLKMWTILLSYKL